MDTTKLIVEYLVAGTLIVISSLFAIASWFPNTIQRLLTPASQTQFPLANQVVLSTIFIALAYGVGIVSEYVAEQVFEGLFNRIKQRRMHKHIETNENIMDKSPVFETFLQTPKEKRDCDQLTGFFGQIRFFVMSHSGALYAEIAAQISRFRLIRVLFLVEAITIIAIISQLISKFSMFWLVMLILVTSIAYANFMAIQSRFNRYCRAIERSYLVLMSEQMKSD